MANPEHVEILKQGVEVWNRWREKHHSVDPDLRNAVLKSADLHGADFSGADLSGANLSNSNLRTSRFLGTKCITTNFSGADLRSAKFMHAKCSKSNFKKADLEFALFDLATLDSANLVEANLWNTIFTGGVFDNTNFSRSQMRWTILSCINLSKAIGLESVVHGAPSTIGIDTIYLSKGSLLNSFLKGAGVPEIFIQYLNSLTNKSFDFYSCFISHSSKDQDFAERLYADLQNKGVRCWFAPKDMKIGDTIWDRIDQSIRIHDKLLLILSEHSIESEWVEDEVDAAYEQERRRDKTNLIPIRLDDAVMHTDKAWASKLRRSRHIGDFTRWKDHDSYQKAFDRLLRDLQAETE